MNKTIWTICDALGIANTAVVVSLQGWDSILSIICSACVALSIVVGVVIKIINAVKQAKKDDGKVSIEEAKQIYEDVKPDVKELVDQISDIKDEITKDK